jgi:hypothetical protein
MVISTTQGEIVRAAAAAASAAASASAATDKELLISTNIESTELYFSFDYL